MKTLSILCSDLHLSHKAPIARSKENWYGVMKRYLKQLRELRTIHSWKRGVAGRYFPPIICAGDIFDKWNSPPELINFAIKHLPHLYAVPGQHDLPNHNYKDIHRSAYCTLVKAKVVTNLIPESTFSIGKLEVVGVPWGFAIPKDKSLWKGNNKIRLAVVHKYIWQEGSNYPGASNSDHTKNIIKKLAGYDAAIFGDNHKGFLQRFIRIKKEQREGINRRKYILNCGGFIRRNSDQIGYHPIVGALKEDGSIQTIPLDCSEDKMKLDFPVENKSSQLCSEEFIVSLKQVAAIGRDFNESVKMLLDKQSNLFGLTKEIVEEVLANGEENEGEKSREQN